MYKIPTKYHPIEKSKEEEITKVFLKLDLFYSDKGFEMNFFDYLENDVTDLMDSDRKRILDLFKDLKTSTGVYKFSGKIMRDSNDSPIIYLEMIDKDYGSSAIYHINLSVLAFGDFHCNHNIVVKKWVDFAPMMSLEFDTHYSYTYCRKCGYRPGLFTKFMSFIKTFTKG
jgi:hypothetical protein